VFVSTSCEAFVVRKIVIHLRYAQQHTRVAHFEKQQHDQRRYLIRVEYIQSMRKVSKKPLQLTVDKENALLLGGVCAKWRYLLACILGREPK
jgi:uncharacterized OsmC-like protein